MMCGRSDENCQVCQVKGAAEGECQVGKAVGENRGPRPGWQPCPPWDGQHRRIMHHPS